MRYLQLLLISMLILTTTGAYGQHRKSISWKDYTYDFSFNMGYGLDVSPERNEFMKDFVGMGVVRASIGKPNSVHRLGLEFFISGRQLDREKLENAYNTQDFVPEDLKEKTKGFNSITALAPGYSLVLGENRFQWRIGANLGIAGISKSSHRMVRYSDASLEYPDHFFQVNHGDRFLGPWGLYTSMYTQLFIRFREYGDFGLTIGLTYAYCNARNDAKYTFGPTKTNGYPDYDQANSELYMEHDKMRLWGITIGFGVCPY